MGGNIPGGFLAERYGGKLVFGIGVLATSMLTIILPICTWGKFGNDNSLSCKCQNKGASGKWCFNDGNFTNDWDSICTKLTQECDSTSYIWILIILRVLMGLFESVTFPALYSLLNYWSTPSERSRMIGISFAGMYIGNILGFPLSSFIIASKNDTFGGWPNVFYFFSLCGILWWIIWCLFVSDSPFTDRFISGKELIYLREQLPPALITKCRKHKNSHYDDEFIDDGTKGKGGKSNDIEMNQSKVDWKHFITNRAALILYLTHFSYNWSFYTLLVELPTYLNDELNYDLSSAGFISVVPYLAQFFVTIFASIIIDKTITSKLLNRSHARMTAQTIGTILPGFCLIACGYIDNATVVVILLSTATGLMGFVNSGFAAAYSDVSPTLSSVMYGVGNTIATFPGVISPILSGWILDGKNKSTEWKIIFYIAFIIFCIGTTSFWVWGTAEKVECLNRKETSQAVNINDSMQYVDKMYEDSKSKVVISKDINKT